MIKTVRENSVIDVHDTFEGSILKSFTDLYLTISWGNRPLSVCEATDVELISILNK